MVAAAILVGAGCAKKSEAPAEQSPAAATGGAEQAAGSTATAKVTGSPCDNPYYPLENGYELHYQTTSQGYTINYLIKQTDVTKSSAKLNVTFDYPKTFTVTQDLVCDDGGIKTTGFLDVAGAMGGMVETETKSVSGEIMPSNLTDGKTWTTVYDNLIRYKTTQIPGLKGDITSKVETVNTVTKTLPELDLGNGLKFSDVKEVSVKSTTTTTMNIDIPGAPSGPQVSESSSTEYWAKGVGLVKIVDGSGVVTTVTKVVNP
jgi:hypothetical protein